MQGPPTLKISEIFFSAEGEGGRQGEPTIFIRLTGCNLRCDFCDTKYAWDEGKETNQKIIYSKVVVIKERYKTNWVSLTGGEPLLQDIRPLVDRLKRAGFKIQIETNGTKPLNFLVDWLTVSPKPPDFFSTQSCRRQATEAKLVVTKNLKLAEIEKVRREFPARTVIWLQPESNEDWSYRRGWRLFQLAAKTGLKNVRLGCQLHKIYSLR
ncbi:MAG TPA: 7-carboxy-7-deazaguanine synthase QueE [Candidatus Saccharicenans sp.]|jgi:organic radical activating enzyme|nr:7-carboxy-7-deazaguanine synthase QueE [Candidatus Saccharicenans sp.]HRD01352.1 7-carboxy-7-deazaguanine synthase QueE [Candidatus Saccharicenans sp.]